MEKDQDKKGKARVWLKACPGMGKIKKPLAEGPGYTTKKTVP